MSRNGSKEERDVVKMFEKYGFGAIRVPASGARTKSDKPDVIAGNGRIYYAVEVKSSKNNYIYIRDEQINELFRFATSFGAVPLVVAKFTREPYVAYNPHLMMKTNSGKYKIQRKWVAEADYFENILQDICMSDVKINEK
ncbi:MAG: Holliday junction resolvase [Methanobrevibacter sp.]|nr:Holliday junction resolvase [Methanobrevibacter sp.]